MVVLVSEWEVLQIPEVVAAVAHLVVVVARVATTIHPAVAEH